MQENHQARSTVINILLQLAAAYSGGEASILRQDDNGLAKRIKNAYGSPYSRDPLGSQETHPSYRRSNTGNAMPRSPDGDHYYRVRRLTNRGHLY